MATRGLPLVAACALAAAAAVAACGVDSYLNCGDPCADGSAGDVVQSTDGPGGDAVSDAGSEPDVFIPPPCTDAGVSCLGAVPSGWTPVAVADGGVQCPNQGFASNTFVTNPQLETGSCSCSACTASGSWTCGVTLSAGGLACTDESFDASASTCWTTSAQHGHFSQDLTRYGTVSCNASTPNGTGAVDTTPVTTCAPTACASDLCALANNGFSVCILHSGSVACPGGYTPWATVGTSASVTCNACPTCSLVNGSAVCTGTSTVYDQLNCNGGNKGSTSINGSCVGSNSPFQSVFYDAGPVPVPNCGGGGGPVSGQAQLTGTMTVCCP
jgi:hypothetical protein